MAKLKNTKLDDSTLEQISGGELDPFRIAYEIVGEILTDPETVYDPEDETIFQRAKRYGCRVYEIKVTSDGIGKYAIAYPSFSEVLLPGDRVYLEHERDGMYGNTIVEKIVVL